MHLFRSIRKLVVASALLLVPAASFAGVFISVGIAPPALPVYTQPLCPGDGYMWTPGYWGYGPDGYYWVPGVWVRPPQVGVLWTPGYWGWGGSAFIFHEGYWGPHIGFYGGVNYGFGYGGLGYEGGYWRNGAFAYNRSVNNINVTHVTNVYNKTVIVNNVTNTRVSYNGGNGGVQSRATVQEQAAVREQHFNATNEQQTHFQAARADRSQLASVNGGHPQMAAARTANEYHAQVQQHGGNAQLGGQHPNNQANLHQNAQPQPHPQAQPHAVNQGAGGGNTHPQAQQPHQQPHAEAQPHAQAQPHAEAHGGGEEHRR
jgi:hypothetical protein